MIDPTIGFGQQALGMRIAEDILHGHMPWWNPYEGAGFPSGESIGDAAFFPLSILLALPRGQAIDRTALEILAGLSMLFLLRQLQLRTVPAVVGGALFALNGPFSWIGGDIANTAPFLPLLIYGIERVRADILQGRSGKWAWVALPIALSLFAGFPESAYLDGLLALAWAAVRLFTAQANFRRPFALALVAGGVIGVLLATPILLAFFDELRVSFAGGHLSGAFGNFTLPSTGVLKCSCPISGDKSSSTRSSFTMGECGGICRHCDSGARSERAVRSDESSNSNSSSGLDRARPWGDVGVPLLHDLFVRIPLVGFIAYCRYLPTSWEFSFAVLAAFALDDALDADAVALFHRYTISVCVVAAVVSLSLIMCGEAIQALLAAHPDYNPWLFRSLELAFGFLSQSLSRFSYQPLVLALRRSLRSCSWNPQVIFFFRRSRIPAAPL